MKILKYLLLLIICFLPVFAKAQSLDSTQKQSLESQLKSACYDQYKKELDIDYDSRDYQHWAQDNLDLLSCYENELTNYPEYLLEIQGLKTKAQDYLQKAEAFDSEQLTSEEQTLTVIPTVTIPAKTRQVFRLLTFCLDSGRSVPSTGEVFYLTGSVDQLKREGNLCEIMRQAKSASSIEDIQNQVWKTQKSPQGEPAQISQTAPTITLASKIKAWVMAIVGFILFLFVLIIGLMKLFKIQSRSLRIFLKIIWIIALIGFAIICGFGVWQMKKMGYFQKLTLKNEEAVAPQTKPNIKTISGKTSLYDAAHLGQITIKAYGTGKMNFIDVAITNNSNQNLELDTACLYFIPALTENTSQETRSSILLGKITKALANPGGRGSQKLGSVGSIGDGPPISEDPKIPEDIMNSAESDDMSGILKQIADQNLSDSLAQFKANPNENTLKNVLNDLGSCQQIGCSSGESAMNDIINSWQKVIDEAISKYQSDPSTENQENLMRNTELGQYIGCNTDAALSVLGLK